jgi:hypothetical protein
VNTTDLLTERGTTHGSFADNAHYGQALRDLFRSSPRWTRMPPVHQEALDMLACKLSRILSGQSHVADHWADLAGYATLAREVCDQ